ncbi:MAG: MarR family transcriptional regulator [Dehalococcoidia bacterium]
MDEEQKYKDAIDSFQRLVNTIAEIENRPRDFGTGDRLYSSEIHTLEVIGDNPKANITELSIKLGVTKSATSQIVKRLERKKYLRRYKEKKNNKEVLLELLDAGKMAYWGHKRYHMVMDAPLIHRMKGLNSEQFDFLHIVMGEINKYMEGILKERT